MKHEVTIDPSCKPNRGPRLVEDGEFPFFDGESDEPQMVECRHCDRLTVLSEQTGDNEAVCVFGMQYGEQGLIAAYTTDQVRGIIEQLSKLVEHLDKINEHRS